jgi:hypothetical protein
VEHPAVAQPADGPAAPAAGDVGHEGGQPSGDRWEQYKVTEQILLVVREQLRSPKAVTRSPAQG